MEPTEPPIVPPIHFGDLGGADLDGGHEDFAVGGTDGILAEDLIGASNGSLFGFL